MRAALLVCAFASAVAAAPEPAPAPRPFPGREWSEPPSEIAALMKLASKGPQLQRAVATTALANVPEAEPYLRYAILSNPNKRLQTAHAALLTATDNRNVNRAAKWAKDGRIDLVVEAICFAQSDEAADEMTKHLFTFASACREKAQTLTDSRYGEQFGPAKTLTDFLKHESARRFSGEKVTLREDQSLVRTEQLVTTGVRRSVAVVRSECIPARDTFNHALSSFLFVNNDITPEYLKRSLVVADGDVLAPSAEFVTSVVITRGSVRGPVGLSVGSYSSVVWAGGDIAIEEKSEGLRYSALFARGEIQASAVKGLEPRIVKAKTKENPFGVRFFETADLGIEVESHPDGVRIKSLAPTSPLALHGLRVGDVIFKLNDTRVDSEKEFRRELRRSVVWEAGVFWLTGDGKRMTRVVPLADVLK